MKYLLKDISFFILRAFYPALDRRASILMYHSIGDNKAFSTVREKNFRKQLQYLQAKKFKIIKLAELIQRLKTGEEVNNCICLTFDDGYEDNYKIAFPLIREYNFPITIFLATGLIGKYFINSQGIKINTLKEEQIREMSDSGLVEFMPHTDQHCFLDSVSREEAISEINKSKETVKKITNCQADIFAYPKGRFSKKVARYLKENDWLGAVGVKEGLVDSQSDLFNLERNSIDSTTSFIQFRGKISSVINKYNSIKRCLKF